MKFTRAFWLLSVFAIMFVVYGCSGSGGDSGDGTTPAVGVMTVIHDQVDDPSVSAGERSSLEEVDTFEFTGYNANNQIIYGPLEVPKANKVVLDDVPLEIAYMSMDYLRNGGYSEYTGSFDVFLQDDFVHEEVNPPYQSEAPSLTKWEVKAKGEKGYQLYLNGNPFTIQGVCYAPAPINFSNKDFPAIGDLFWDSYTNEEGKKVNNWYSLWGEGQLGGTGYNARDDLNQIRQMGANAIRVYSMISRQPNKDGSIPPAGTGHHFTHQQFLDMCWNNGKNPIYVLVDIPMPESIFYPDGNPFKHETNQVEFFEHVLKETVQDMADHPAVMGFNIMNEHNYTGVVFPSAGADINKERADYFFAQAKKYADLIKSIVNPSGSNKNKLVGWASFDDPVWTYASSVAHPEYAGMLSSFDFWGVNTYQYGRDSASRDAAFNYVLGDTADAQNYKCGLGYLTGAIRKPVIFTEYGWPATGHNPDGESQPNGEIQESETTIANTALAAKEMFPRAYSFDILLGAYYFEFSDEWWKQDQKAVWNGTTAAADTGRPNYYGDEEGFGLFSIKRGEGRSDDDDPWDEDNGGPRLPADVVTARQAIVNEVCVAWGQCSKVKLKNQMNPESALCWFVWGENAQDWRVIGSKIAFGETQDLAIPSDVYQMAVQFSKEGVAGAPACLVSADDVAKIKNGQTLTIIGQWQSPNGNGECLSE